MKPPKVLYIGAADVDVKFRKQLSSPTLIGEFDGAGSNILLRNDQSESSLRDTLIHEALHAIVYLSGIRENLSLSHEDEEKLVVALSPWLLALLRDNPKLVEFLLENRDREY